MPVPGGVKALVLGRGTYESFAQAWPSRGGDPFTDRINGMPKYVASRTLKDATWNSTILDGDAVEQVADLSGIVVLKYAPK